MSIKRTTLKFLLPGLLLLSASVFTSNQTIAAVATATVTVNVVPASQIRVSPQFAFNIPLANNQQQSQSNTSQVEISTVTDKSSISVNVEDDLQNTYDLSISSASTLSGPVATDTMTINNMTLAPDAISGDDNAQQLQINGELTIPGNAGNYTGTTEITVNYN
jgi:hypothetical protein